MRCPLCNCSITKVTDTARSYGKIKPNRRYMIKTVKRAGKARGEKEKDFLRRARNANVRRRVCSKCSAAFLTVETLCHIYRKKAERPRGQHESS